MKTITLEFKGLSALLVHSDRFANPLDPDRKAHAALTSKRKKTDEDHAEIAFSEWKGGLYFDDEIGVYMPSINVRSCIVDGGKLNKLGASVQRGTLIMDDKLPLIYDGPKTIDGLWKDKRFSDARSVVVSRARLMRYRPCFPDWSLRFDLYYDQSVIEREQIIQCATNAGSFIGLGDYRPNKGGPFGRFTVAVVA